jgi:hypothetical protein
MRELTLIETGYLGGMLVLSLVLPLFVSFLDPRDARTRRACMKTVWTGQTLGAIAALSLLCSASVGFYAMAFSAASCVCCAFVLRRQIQTAHPSQLGAR